ncbi:apolipoprotein N-acyltransferase, partial [bacterium]|nr:apolipoprotein N-acyltransferase [bacterium]
IYLYILFFSCSIVYIKKTIKIDFMVSAPLVWAFCEYLRGAVMSGFPWDNIGYAFYNESAFLQCVEITGVSGLSMLALFANALVYRSIKYFIKNLKDKKSFTASVRLPVLFLSLFFVFLILIRQWGNGRIDYFRNIESESLKKYTPLKAALIQADIPQNIKWDESSESKILSIYGRFTREAAKKNPDLIIWPESSLPGFFKFDRKETYFIFELMKELKIPLLFGGNRIEIEDDNQYYYNSAYYVTPETDKSPMALSGVYDKIHLVPYGEYIPHKKILNKIFPWLESAVPFEDFSFGDKADIFLLKNFKFGVSICFEDIFAELIRKISKQDADFIVNITNDAWYMRTGAPYQHFYMAKFRAVENRVPFVRCANTGITGYINSYGETTLLYGKKSSLIFDEGILYINIPKRIFNENTFYTRHGEIFLYCASVFSVLLLLISFVYSCGKFLRERLEK